jgi:hypothetical protein
MKRVLAATLTAGLSLAGCGEDSKRDGKRVEAIPRACPKESPPVPLPSSFPDSFPLPDGTRITHVERDAATKLTIVDAVVPLGFEPTISFFQDEVPKAGYTVDEGDIEPDEVEALFSGHGVDRGSWIVFKVPGCPPAVKLKVTAGKG